MCRERARVRTPGSQAKYGYAHQDLRARLAPQVAAGFAMCSRCGLRIEPGQAWDLDHGSNGGYRGPSHASCNRAAGADVTNAKARRFSEPPDGPWDEPIEDPSGGWWGPVSELKGGRPYRPRWSRNWLA